MSDKNYAHNSHTHCYSQQSPLCGLNGHHCCLCDIVTSGEKGEKSANFLQVESTHCFKCHKTFPSDFNKRPHVLDCEREVKPCKNWDGKTCEFGLPKEEKCCCGDFTASHGSA